MGNLFDIRKKQIIIVFTYDFGILFFPVLETTNLINGSLGILSVGHTQKTRSHRLSSFFPKKSGSVNNLAKMYDQISFLLTFWQRITKITPMKRYCHKPNWIPIVIFTQDCRITWSSTWQLPILHRNISPVTEIVRSRALDYVTCIYFCNTFKRMY